MQQPGRGRKRSEAVRAAILRATCDELKTSGYDKLSVDRIAAAAGAGRPPPRRRQAGQFPAGSPAAALLSQAIIGAVLYRLLTRPPVTADYADDLINAVCPTCVARGTHGGIVPSAPGCDHSC